MNKKSTTKIIQLHEGYFAKKKRRPLSRLMISALLNAYKRQIKGIPFGQADIDGPFSALAGRGLIKYKNNRENDKVAPTWTVTEEAIEMLNSQGIKLPS